MISKKLAVPLSIIMLFCFSHGSIAGGLHFGIIDAIEGKVGEVRQRKVEIIKTTTDSNGETTFYDKRAEKDVTVQTTDASTQEPVEQIEVQYVNTGTNVFVDTEDPLNRYYPNISLAESSQASQSIVRLIEPVTVIFIGLILYNVGKAIWKFITDPPAVESIPTDKGLIKVCATGDLNHILSIATVWNVKKAAIGAVTDATVAIARWAGTEAIKLGLEGLGFDFNKDYEFCYYTTYTGAIVGPAFIIDRIIPVNELPTVSIADGPSGTIDYDDVTFTWNGSDTDGTIAGYYYDLDDSTPDTWTTGTSHTFNNVSEGSHTFYVQSQDNNGATSSVASRSFTYSPAVPVVAAITLRITPNVGRVGEIITVRATLSESNGIGMDLNYIKVAIYDELGDLVYEEEISGVEAHEAFDRGFGTHYLPGYGTLEGILWDNMQIVSAGRQIVTMGGTDDNGNFVADSDEFVVTY